jgi:hypothetical protein
MNNQEFQTVCAEQIARLDSIAKDLGIPDKPIPSPLLSQANAPNF